MVGRPVFSLYAWHWPTMLLLDTLVLRTGLSPYPFLVVRLVVGLFLSLGVASPAYRLFERPLLVRSRRTDDAFLRSAAN